MLTTQAHDERRSSPCTGNPHALFREGPERGVAPNFYSVTNMDMPLSDFQFSERRAFARKECQKIPIPGLGFVCDVSLGGIAVEAEEVPGDSDIPLNFNLGSNHLVMADARVVNERRSSQNRILGLKFIRISIDSRMNILMYLSNSRLVAVEEEIRNSLTPFIHSWTSEFEWVSAEFKMEVADFRLYLNQLKQTLNEKEKKLFVLPEEEKQKVSSSLIEFYELELQGKVHKLILGINNVIWSFTENDHVLHRQYFRAQLLDLTNDSAFFNRALYKPLGYAGDYQMMEILYHGLRKGNTLWQKVINSCLTSIPLGNAVRNRAWYLAEKIIETMAVCERPNILSLACGPCEEVAIVMEKKAQDVNYYLVDQDKEALSYAQEKMNRARFRCKVNPSLNFQCDTVRRFLNDSTIVMEYPKMDLIYTAGLFDYLRPEAAKRLIRVLYSMLAPGGKLVIGNFTRGNFSYFIEYAADWFLIYRTEEELLALVPEDLEAQNTRVEKEPSGVNLFLCFYKPDK